jgi:peptide/nickel transport system permease protein
VFGFALGTLAALNRGKLIDTLTMSIAMTGVSMPSFWLGLLLLLAFAVKLHWFPVISGNGWLGLVLPALTLGYQASAIISRLTRSCLIDVLSQDYVATARAKGLRESRVIWAHALKNTLIPVITIIGLQFGSLLGGAIIVETVFVRQGIGQLLVHGIQQRDFPVVQGTILFIAVAYLLVNLAVDLLYGFIDPRTRYS